MTVHLHEPGRAIDFLARHFPEVIPRYSLLSAPQVMTLPCDEEAGYRLRVFDQGECAQEIVGYAYLNRVNVQEPGFQELVLSVFKPLTDELWCRLQMRKRRFYAGWR